MNEPPRLEPGETPPLAPKPAPKFSFGAQVAFGVFTVVVLTGICWTARDTKLPLLCLRVVPLVAIVGCFFRAVRGFAIGLPLGIGLSAIALVGLCFATFKV